MLSTEQQAIIQSSIERLTCSTRQLAATFYDHLFARAPQVRQMFPPQMSPQVIKLEQTLVYVIGCMNDTETLFPILDELGEAHGGFGAEPAHYEAVGASLLDALADSIENWDDTQKAAWTALYTMVAERMIAAGAPTLARNAAADEA